ncbi:MAG: alpha-amylase [Chloroflexi bacterium]|nr:alpha-amylase [Chloroflexota bacterium]
MSKWPDKLVVYEVNTWVWLTTLSRQYGEPITLLNVPEEAVDLLAKPGLDFIWFMGVWQRNPAGRANALKYKHEYQPALPDLTDEDVIGSAYAVGRYEVDIQLGGREGLAALRQRLNERGIGVILDYVPNHIATDHPWLYAHPEYIVQGTAEDLEHRPSDFFAHRTVKGEQLVMAHGRDPLFPGWSDTAQLNIFSPAVRDACRDTVLDIAAQCDGVRCDMAMLMLTDVFASTWNGYVEAPPPQEYWEAMIQQVHAQHPDFLFIAEVYWGKEYELLLQGFDYAYDKIVYDRVLENDVQKLREHLQAPVNFLKRMMAFLENHDEPRAYDKLGPHRSYPAATLLMTLPGAVLLHDGQLTGRLVKLPVQIGRQPAEPINGYLEEHYLRLMAELESPIYRQGEWQLFDIDPIGRNNLTHFNLLAYGWYDPATGDHRLIVINMTQHHSQGWLRLHDWGWLNGATWQMVDVTTGATYDNHSAELTSRGWLVDVEAYESHILRFELVREHVDGALNGNIGEAAYIEAD